jgi:hypothetical protein
VITRGQLSPCSRSKEVTASEATPLLSGHLRISLLKILLPCSSTSHNKGTSHHKRKGRLVAIVEGGLGFVEIVTGSYVQYINHLMVTIIAVRVQITMVTWSPWRMARTCWQIRVKDHSQLLNLKSGKFNTL